MQQRLKDIGDWLNVNGEAIYDTKSTDNTLFDSSGDNIFTTQKDTSTYIFMLQWKPMLSLKTTIKPNEITLLGYSKSLEFKYDNDILNIILPPLTPDLVPCQHAWTLKIR